jgi:hypothetical protein
MTAAFPFLLERPARKQEENFAFAFSILEKQGVRFLHMVFRKTPCTRNILGLAQIVNITVCDVRVSRLRMKKPLAYQIGYAEGVILWYN